MTKVTTTKSESSEQVLPADILKKLRRRLTLFSRDFSFHENFLDFDKPWILVPNGSFLNGFDWVPAAFREGPWNIFVCLHFAVTVYSVLLLFVYFTYTKPAVLNATTATPSSNNDFEYFNAYSPQWWYNLAGFAWTIFVTINIIVAGAGCGSWITFTVQTWTLLVLRHGLSVLVPFWPSHTLLTITEYLRLPMLVNSSVTFFAWNFLLAPIIYGRMDTPTKRKMFRKIFTNFRLIQLHVFVIIFATIQGVWATPSRKITDIDFCAACLAVLFYSFLYLFFLDRLGIHLYLVYSPRSILAIFTWTITYAAIYGFFTVWRDAIHHYAVDVDFEEPVAKFDSEVTNEAPPHTDEVAHNYGSSFLAASEV